jgi:hypothetical protein
VSDELTIAKGRRLRFRLLLFLVRIWLWWLWARLYFPVAVLLKRLAVPRLVFNLGISHTPHLYIFEINNGA